MKLRTSTALALLSAFSTFVSAVPLETRQCECTTAITDELVFDVSMATFQQRRAAKDPSCCDWSSNGCSWSPDNPLGFDFEPACDRHDFGYRNFKNQNRFSEDNRLRIDNQFKSDLYNQCANENLEGTCRGLADVYYNAVRRCGDGNCLDKRLEVS